MQITVTTLSGQIFPMDVSEDLDLESFKAFCEAESGWSSAEMVLLFNGSPLLDNHKTMKDLGIGEGDMIVLERIPKPAARPATAASGGALASLDFSKIKIPPTSSASTSKPRPQTGEDPASLYELLLANPDQVALLKQQNPRLGEALSNYDEFVKILKEQQAARAERERMRIRMLTADPMDIEAQRLIEKEIENKNIEANMEWAMEYTPESFGTVVMLYIDCKVNGFSIKAFVDSGAQATIMSKAAAERCNIMRLVDKRWAGVAKGVGVQKIIGRVHLANLQIKEDFFPCSFSILEQQPMDMLLGLDMLKRHQCCIDLRRNMLVIGSTGTETPFLPESELSECARLSTRMENDEESDRQLAQAVAQSEAESKRLKRDSGEDEAIRILPTDKFDEEAVQSLMKHGFPRDKCILELRNKNGDVTEAMAALFAKAIQLN